tara:strand:+ start:528 stop:728 length:201 start_codon:yes stop_codon:yes gene_type:complete
MGGLERGKMSLDNKTASDLYGETIDALKICIESLKFISENCPTNGIVRGRAEDTLSEVTRILNLDK